MLKRLVFALLFLVPSVALAQVQQSGNVTSGHIVQWITTGVIGDAGSATAPATNPAPSSFGLINNAGPAYCVLSALTTVAYNRLCFGVGTSSHAFIQLDALGGATAQGLDLIINGNTLAISSTGALPACSTSLPGTVPATGGGTSLFLRADCQFATPAGGGNFTGPGSSTNKHFVQFSGATGTVGQDAGLTPTNATDTAVVMQHGAAVTSNCPKYNDTTGTLVDSGGTCGAPTAGTGLSYSGATLNLSVLPPPQGRLTLTSATPVMTSDVTAASTVYYDSYIGNQVPAYNGTAWVYYTITGDEISLALDSNSGHTGYQASGSLFDLFVGNNSGITLCTGPAWSSTTTRGTGAGTTQISKLNGVYTNTVSMTCRFGSATGNTFACGVNQCTYIGTMYATANGQSGMQFKPTAAGGGSNNVLGLYNAYNRVSITSIESDSTASWTYTSGTIRSANASTSNRINFIDGLQQSFLSGSYEIFISNSGSQGGIGIGVNSTSAQTGSFCSTGASSGTVLCTMRSAPLLGLNYFQALEDADSGSGTATFQTTSASNQRMSLILDIMM